MIRTTITSADPTVPAPPPVVEGIRRIGAIIEDRLGTLIDQFRIAAGWTLAPRPRGLAAELVLTAEGGIRTRTWAFTAQELGGTDPPEALLLALSDLTGQLMRHLDQAMRAREERIRQLEEALAVASEDH